MATATDVLTALRAELVAQGLVRTLNVAGPLPPMILDPVSGPPGPGDGLEGAEAAGLIVSALPGGDIPPGYADGYMLRTTIDLRYRGRDSRQIAQLDHDITEVIYTPGGGARQAWEMGGLFMIETRAWSGLTPLQRAGGIFDYVAKVYVETYR